MSVRHARMLQCGIFYGPCTLPSNHNCPGTVPEKKGHWVTFRLVAHSWKAGCKVWHTVSPHSFVTPRLWSCDTLMSPQCQLVDTEYMTPFHSVLLSVGTFSKTVKTLRDRAKLSASDDGWQRDAAARKGGAVFFCCCFVFDMCDTIQSKWLFGFLSKTAEFICVEECQTERGFVYLLEVMLKWEWNGDLTFL